MSGSHGDREFWDQFYLRDPDAFGSSASGLARWALPMFQRALPAGRILELGCGTGRDLAFFAAHGFEVSGVDFSDVAVRAANQKLAALRDERPPIQWAVSGVAREYLASQSAQSQDAVFSNLFFNMVIDPAEHRRLFRQIARVLSNEGLHVFSARSVHDPWYGKGTQLAPDSFDPGGAGRPMRYFSEEYVRGLAEESFQLLELREIREGESDFPITVLYAAGQRVRSAAET